MSLHSIFRYIMSTYGLGKGMQGASGVNRLLKMALRKGASRGLFRQMRSSAKGAAGSFKLASQVMGEAEEDVMDEAQFL